MSKPKDRSRDRRPDWTDESVLLRELGIPPNGTLKLKSGKLEGLSIAQVFLLNREQMARRGLTGTGRRYVEWLASEDAKNRRAHLHARAFLLNRGYATLAVEQ
jgi:hypothetical protein